MLNKYLKKKNPASRLQLFKNELPGGNRRQNQLLRELLLGLMHLEIIARTYNPFVVLLVYSINKMRF